MKRRLLRNQYGEVRLVWFFAGIGAAVCAVLLVVVALANAAIAKGCGEQADAMGRDHRYGLFSGCLVETDNGVYVPLDNYRLTQQEVDS